MDTVYTDLGQVEKTSIPYISGTIPTYPGISGEYYEVTDYDVLGRPKDVTKPNGATTSIDYAGLSVSTTNDLGYVDSRTTNARGELIKATDANLKDTNYRYDPHGNLIEIKDPAGNTITATYDIRGRKKTTLDPDAGLMEYEYNPFGEIISQTDAKNQEMEIKYDKLGRMIERTDDLGGLKEETSKWIFDTATMGEGKLEYVERGGVEELRNTFDSLGRLETETRVIGGTSYVYKTAYDNISRLKELTYPATPTHPNGLVVEHLYSPEGYLKEVKNKTTNSSVWLVERMTNRGEVGHFILGNGVHEERVFDDRLNLLTQARAITLTDLHFFYDSLGNLERREDHKQPTPGSGVVSHLTEKFLYDPLNRMTESKVMSESPDIVKTYEYDTGGLGNIKTKTGVGTYHYEGPRPHAVTKVDNGQGNVTTYDYDDNGNMKLDSSGRSIEYSPFNKPTSISQGSTTVNFTYGADRARIIQTKSNNTTHYVGGLYEKHTSSGGTVTHTHYIRAGNETIGIYKTQDSGPSTMRYLHRDHLGSVSAVTDETGNAVENLSYDPHGRRRNNVEWLDYAVVVPGGETDRGFTGHEHLDDVGLIHMNGRIQDPKLGRFLSPDPFVQFPTDSQSFNRYSYVRNNPLSRVDPSGFSDITLTTSPTGGGLIASFGGTSINVGFGPQRNEFISYALWIHAFEWWRGQVAIHLRKLEAERLAREAATPVTPPEIVAPISPVAPWQGFNQMGLSTTTTRIEQFRQLELQLGFFRGEDTDSFEYLGRELLNITGYGPDVPTGELIFNGTFDALSFLPGAAVVLQPIKSVRIGKRIEKALKLDATKGAKANSKAKRRAARKAQRQNGTPTSRSGRNHQDREPGSPRHQTKEGADGTLDGIVDGSRDNVPGHGRHIEAGKLKANEPFNKHNQPRLRNGKSKVEY